MRTSTTSTEIDFKLRLLTAYLIIMGRLHSNGKGISASAIPYSRTPPAWLKTTPEQVVDQICKLAKKGATPSQIGVVLRDSHGIAQVKVVTGKMDRCCATRRQEAADIKLQVTRFCVSSSPTVRCTLYEKGWHGLKTSSIYALRRITASAWSLTDRVIST